MISLKPLSLDDVSPFYEWINDDMSIKYSLSLFQSLNTKDQIDHWFHSVVNDSTSFNRGIFLTDSNRLIGYAGICNISKANRSGEYFIFIGDRREWGKGIGSEVTRLILGIGFEKLELHRIMLTVSEPNYAAVKHIKMQALNSKGECVKPVLETINFTISYSCQFWKKSGTTQHNSV